MRGTFRTFSLFLFGCLFPTSESDSVRLLPPRNVSLRWVTDFQLGLFWDPPQHVGPGCQYETSMKLNEALRGNTLDAPPWLFKAMDVRHVRCNVTTVCNDTRSEPAFLNVDFPELVKDLECFLYVPQQASCRWSPPARLQDLQFFYELLRVPPEPKTPAPPTLQECPSYTYTGAVRTGCDLQGTELDIVRVLINGTLEGRPVRTTFERPLKDGMRPPPLKWSVKKSGEAFRISWVPPDVLLPDDWAIEINHTDCNGAHKIFSLQRKTSHVLQRDPHCQSKLAIRAKDLYSDGHTPWSEWKELSDDGPNVLLFVTIIVPVLIVVLTTSICVCLQRNKEKIFPKVPEPRNLLFDLYDTTKTTVYDLYTPAKEEVGCKITLVTDLQPSKSA